MPAGTGVRAVFDQACAESGLQPGIALEASAPSAVADLAARGLGAAIFSATMATGFSDRLSAVPIAGVDLPSLLALVWSPSPSLALREFLRFARQAFAVEASPKWPVPDSGRAPVSS
jgi:DNA-binding transcriptional LysR family regulator